MFKDYYQILGISQAATPEEIKHAYRSMSKKWHPDHNPNQDVTSIMQDINEAYYILSNELTRISYDKEYCIFVQQGYRQKGNNKTEEDTNSGNESTVSSVWTYEYEVKDEALKENIRTAREKAFELVKEFMKSIHETSKIAAKGAWENCKSYIYGIVILTIIGVIARLCSGDKPEVVTTPPKQDAVVDTLSPFFDQKKWMQHSLYDGAITLSVPSTVELRAEDDPYTQRLRKKGIDDSGCVIFQQDGLSTAPESEVDNHYCRIMVFYDKGSDYFHCNESEFLDSETRAILREAVIQHLGGFELLTEPRYRWICSHQGLECGTNAIEIRYRRRGNRNQTVSCIMYYLFNYNEMAQVIVSYREQEKELWLPDFENVIKTFRWKKENYINISAIEKKGSKKEKKEPVYHMDFPQYGFSIDTPCVMEDVSAHTPGHVLVSYGGVTDANDREKMSAYQLVVSRAPIGYRDATKQEYERIIDEAFRAQSHNFQIFKPIRFSYDEFPGYACETTHNGYRQKGVIFAMENYIIAMTVISNNDLDSKFNKFANSFKRKEYSH